MDVTIRIEDDADVRRALDAIGRQAPFALSLGINRAGESAQRAVRESVAERFALRGTQRFFDRGVVLRKGNKREPDAELSVGVTGGWPGTATARASAILARHEDASTRTSEEFVRAGKQLVPAGFFLPAKGLRTRSTNVPRRLYPSAIGATIRFDGRNPGDAYYANPVRQRGRGTRQVRDSFFVIPRVGIFQRQSGGLGSKVRPIWWFSRTIRTPARTGFQDTATRTLNAELDDHILRAIDVALATAR